MAYPSLPTSPPLPPLNSIIVCKYKYIVRKEEEGSQIGKSKSRKESIKRKDEGNKNEWGGKKRERKWIIETHSTRFKWIAVIFFLG